MTDCQQIKAKTLRESKAVLNAIQSTQKYLPVSRSGKKEEEIFANWKRSKTKKERKYNFQVSRLICHTREIKISVL